MDKGVGMSTIQDYIKQIENNVPITKIHITDLESKEDLIALMNVLHHNEYNARNTVENIHIRCKGYSLDIDSHISLVGLASLKSLSFDFIKFKNGISVADCNELLHLKVCDAGLTCLPSINRLPKLYQLDVSSNKISSLSTDEMSGLPSSLRQLRVSGNPVEQTIQVDRYEKNEKISVYRAYMQFMPREVREYYDRKELILDLENELQAEITPSKKLQLEERITQLIKRVEKYEIDMEEEGSLSAVKKLGEVKDVQEEEEVQNLERQSTPRAQLLW